MAEQNEQNETPTPEEGEAEAPAEAQTTDEQEEASGEAAGEETPAVTPEEAAIARLAEQTAGDSAVSEEEDGERNMRKERVGVVVSAKMDKTIVVSIERSKKHPMYKKYLTRSARKMTHDENEEAGEGDTVRIAETRPISKNKRWRLVEVIERAA